MIRSLRIASLAGLFAAIGACAVPAAVHAMPDAVDVSREAGVAEISLTRGAAVFDLNGDGWEDLLVGRHWDAFPRLYRNNGDGTFTDIHETAFPEVRPRDRHGCDGADVDQDGLTDIFCTTGGKKGGTGPNKKELWMQQADGTFRLKTQQYRVTAPYGRSRDAAFIDANGDQYPDLVIGNTYPRKDGHRSPTQLFVNQEGERFRNARGYGLNHEVGSNSLQVVDYDGDGDEDVFLCGRERLYLFSNVGERRFRNVSRKVQAAMECESAVLARLNGDRHADLVRATKTSLRVHLWRRGAFRSPAYTLRKAGGFDLAAGDINGDRRDDIYFLRSGDRDADLRDLMLLNRRGGHAFKRTPMPQTRRGVGEAVESFDYDRNGHDDFLVMNGHRKAAGPIRLIAFH
jgi:FG-GAP-like repeat